MKQYSKRHYFENFILSIFIFFCYFGQVSEARDYTVRADVSTRSAVLGSSLEFFITVEGTQDADAPALSEIDGFQTRYVGPSRQFSMVNGNISNSINFRYVLVPTRTGDLEIPALTLNVNGQGYTTQAIPIKVFDSSQTALDDAKENTQKTLADKLSLVFSLSQDTVYLHQRVPVKVMFLKSDLDIADPHYPTLEEKGIVFEPFTEHKMDAQVIKGTMFDIVEFDSYLFPTRTGELEIGPMVMDLNLIAKNTSQQGSYDRPFSDDFFNNFINGPRKVPVQLKSKQVTLKVMDLPEEGRPENFSGGVGQFRFNVAASPLNVRVGDPITLKIEVAGNGLLHAITMPELKESDDFKVYDPVVREENGVKYLEQVIIPKNTDVKNIPMIAFSYFDPSVAKYQTVQDGGMA
ncbi:MAG: protein BatD, partial [Candidatus Omnitrophica bacterium]|nr:protein BatD [Candidatus Omnitrophota bacterium]